MIRRFTEPHLVLATHNLGKVQEMRALLSGRAISVSSARDHAVPEPVEDGKTFVENALIKARAVCRATGMPALADDSGLEVDALDGAPGVYTADWAETQSGRDFDLAMNKVHAALLDRDAARPWIARFRCVLVLAWPDGHELVTEGAVEGQLVWPTRGAHGHGFDPMFQPDGFTETFSEMPFEQKNQMSHRARAFSSLLRDVFT